ncbi:MAG: TonB-dependent receptor [Alphaproteobacteria bacterium]|nr:TonB-dependent receptor [Alphaproteobacteria bacterium]
MRSPHLTLLSCTLAAMAISLGSALAEEHLQIVEIDIAQTYPGQKTADDKFSLETILGEIHRQFGWSFIFDSRVVSGKTIKPIKNSSDLENTLADHLSETGLLLKEISDNTFVITAIPSTDESKVRAPQEKTKPFNDVIIVTSSSAVKSSPAISGKIFELDEQYLNYFNAATPDRAIFDLPQTLASITPTNTVLFGALAGVSFLDMRGLGTNRSMVLVNGRPVTPTFNEPGPEFGVDLNRFATPFLERVEVQTTPSSARHGSGATVGAVNFVLRSNLKGAEAGAHYGVSKYGDREQLSMYFLGGKDFLQNSANVTFGVYLAQSTGLIGADRSVTSEGFGLSGFTEKGRLQGVVLENGSFAPFPGGGSFVPNLDGTVSPFIGSPDQLFNAISPTTILPELDRFMGYMSSSANISNSLRVYAEIEAGLNATKLQIAPVPAARTRGPDLVIGSGAAIPIDNPTLPQSVLDLVQDNFGVPVQSVVLDRRYVELGPRRDKLNRLYIDLAIGAEVSRNEKERYALSYRFGRTGTDWSIRNRVNAGNLSTALQPDLCEATPGCATIDLFTPAGISPQAQEFIRTPPIRSKYILERHEISISASNSLSGILADDITLQAGADFEYSLMKIIARSNPDIILIGTDDTPDARGTIFNTDLYGNVALPFLSPESQIGALEVTTDFRFTTSSVYDSFTNLEARATWRPNDMVELSAFGHRGHRAPGITELFAVSTRAGFPAFDPCGSGLGSASAIIVENCLSNTPLGVGSGFTQDNSLAQHTFFGNPNLASEEVKFYGASATIRPTEITTYLPGQMGITATWHSYQITNQILFPDDSVFDCYSSVSFSDDSCGINPLTGAPRIIRNPVTRQITSIEESARNFGAINWRGLDIEAHYVLKPEANGLFDELWINLLHTYTDRVVSVNQQGDAERLEGLLGFPRHQSLASAGVNRGPISLAILFNRRGKVLTARTNNPFAKVPAVFYLDTSLRVELNKNIYFQFGVENLLDRDPPLASFSFFNNRPTNFYDFIGRRYSFSTRIKF